MKNEDILSKLEDAARSLAIRLDYDDLKKGEVNTHGGAFVLKGARRILIHKHLTVSEKVEALAEILSNIESYGISLPLEVREHIVKVLPHRVA